MCFVWETECVCRENICVYTCHKCVEIKGQRGGTYSLFSTWVPGIKLRSSDTVHFWSELSYIFFGSTTFRALDKLLHFFKLQFTSIKWTNSAPSHFSRLGLDKLNLTGTEEMGSPRWPIPGRRHTVTYLWCLPFSEITS